jgi:hypothetical protein
MRMQVYQELCSTELVINNTNMETVQASEFQAALW